MSHFNPTKLPAQIAWCVAILFFVSSLLPFAFMGEYWVMFWVFFTAPISTMLKETYGNGIESYFRIGLTSALCSAAWALIVYAVIRLLQRLAK